MVMLAQDSPVPAYEIYDERGRPIGRVVLPRHPGVLGAGTVYLSREPRMPPLAPAQRVGPARRRPLQPV